MFPADIEPDDFELQAVLQGLGTLQGRRVLDVGCAKGRFVQALAQRGARMVGLDPAGSLLRAAARHGSPLVQSSATSLPFASASFDALVCVEVVEHIPDIDRAVAEMSRVLRPGGRAILIDKNPLGLGYHRLYPNWLYKRFLDREGAGSYPKGFPFREQWHSARGLRRRLQGHFGRVTVRYLDGRVRGKRRWLLAPLFRLAPLSRPDLAWIAEKQGRDRH
jgi:SAM-dependent methyltransferase